ncbi:MAG: hypothetical protein ABSA79_10555 [Candidatus Bathyarchaeia archaeon]
MQLFYTFEEAKALALARLRPLSNFFENLNSQFPGNGLLDIAINLRFLETKLSQSTDRCFDDNEFRQLDIVSRALIEFRPFMQPKLRAIWDLYNNEIFPLMRTKNKSYDLQQFINSEMERISQVDDLSNRSIPALQNNRSSILSALSLLLLTVIRFESIQDTIETQLRQTLIDFNLRERYDIAEICSVESKVERRTRSGQVDWETDVKAIRNAVAHCRFIISQQGHSWVIVFNNNQEGSNFNRTYSQEDFENFFDRHSLLYKFQLHLWMLLELLPLFATYLCIKHNQTGCT